MLLNHQDVQQFSHLELLAKQVVEGFITGLHKSPFHGFSVEFAEHRLYNTGESTRHIDWKLFGRTDKLFVKRFEEETNLRCQIVIDGSASMYFPYSEKKESVDKISFSVYCAAALIYLLKAQRDAVGLSVFSDKVDIHTHAKSTSVHHKMLFSEMEKLIAAGKPQKNKKTFAAKALHEIAENIHARSLVIIFSDMFDNSPGKTDELFAALNHLRHNKHEVILFHVVDKQKELNFDFENHPYLFTDLETGEQVKVLAGEVKEYYLKSITAFTKNLMLKCAQYKIDYTEADIHKGYEQILHPYLIRRGMVNDKW